MKTIFYILILLLPLAGCTQDRIMRINAAGKRVHVNKSGFPGTAKIKITFPFNPYATTSPYIVGQNIKVVKTGGTVGVDCDYTSITAAEADITDATVNKQYTLFVKKGTLNETGTFSSAFGIYVGITLKDYIHIVGESQSGVIINGPEAASSANESLVDCIHVVAKCLIKNVTLQAHNAKYPIHADQTNSVYDLWVENCTLHHLGSVTGLKYDIGIGFYKDQKITLVGCTLLNGGVFCHGNAGPGSRDNAKPWSISVSNSTMPAFTFFDYIEYAGQTVTLSGNTLGAVTLNAFSTVYDANPGVATCNQGTKVFTTFFKFNNTVTSVTQNAEATSILGGTMTF
jgi:hypothetical protein